MTVIIFRLASLKGVDVACNVKVWKYLSTQICKSAKILEFKSRNENAKRYYFIRKCQRV